MGTHGRQVPAGIRESALGSALIESGGSPFCCPSSHPWARPNSGVEAKSAMLGEISIGFALRQLPRKTRACWETTSAILD